MRDKRFCRNSFSFEGNVLEPVTATPTKSGRSRVTFALLGEDPRSPGPIRIGCFAYDEHADSLLEGAKLDERLIVQGNFHNPPRSFKNYHLTTYVVTSSRAVSRAGNTLLNRWEFEGRIAVNPYRKNLYRRWFVTFGIWQPSITMGKTTMVRRMPVILNVIIPAEHRLADEALSYRKDDEIWAVGRLWRAKRPAKRTWPFPERLGLMDRDAADLRMMRKTTAALSPDLDVFEI